jgi:hypothetical protein
MTPELPEGCRGGMAHSGQAGGTEIKVANRLDRRNGIPENRLTQGRSM